MQKLIILYILLLTCTPLMVFASMVSPPDSLPKQQELQVVFVKGDVRLQSTGKVLRKNDFFRMGETLKFAKPENRVITMNDKRGLFVALPDARKKAGYLLEPLQIAVNTRPGKIMNYLGFQKFLDGRRLLALGDTLNIEIAGNELEMNDDKFFYIQYQWSRDAEPINKRLAHSGKNLIIEKSALFSVDNRAIDPAETSGFKLFYFNKPTNESTLINPIDIVFADLEELYKEVNAIVELLGARSKKSEVKEAVLQYIHTQYGEPMKTDVENWLKKNWGL